MGALIAASCDLDALLALAGARPRAARPRVGPRQGPPRPPASPAPVVAVAGGAAFTFGYTEQAELLEAAGAQVAPFDPLRDEDLPEGTAGLILGGGFPEVHAAGLSANERLRERVAALAGRGAPVAAECAGLLYLARTLDDRPMCGVLDVRAAMTPEADPRLPARGGRDGFGAGPGGRRGARPRVPPHRDRPREPETSPPGGSAPASLEGHVAGSVVASYLHTHWAGHPAAAARFTAACAEVLA